MAAKFDRARHGLHNLFDPNTIANPAAYYEHIAPLGDLFYDHTSASWVSAGYSISTNILKDQEHFSAARVPPPTDPTAQWLVDLLNQQVLFADSAVHGALRDGLAGPFRPGVVNASEAWMRELVETVLALMPEYGQVDLIQDFCARLAAPFVAKLLGVGVTLAEVEGWASSYEHLLGSVSDLPNALELSILPILDDAITALTTHARQCSDDGLLSALAAQIDTVNDFSAHDKYRVVAANALVVVGGGFQTLAQIVSSILIRTARTGLRPGGSDETARWVQETIRLDGSSQYLGRRCVKTFAWDGNVIQAGQSVVLLLGAANRDPQVFRHSSEFRPDLRRKPHLGYGFGAHYCLGAPYANRLAALAVEHFLAKYVRISMSGDESWGPHPNTRCRSRALANVAVEDSTLAVAASSSTGSSSGHLIHELWSEAGGVLGQTSVAERLSSLVRFAGQSVAVEHGDRKVSFDELASGVIQYSDWLTDKNVGAGSVVGIACRPSPEMIAAIFAVLANDASFLLLDPKSGPERIKFMVSTARCDFVVTDQSSVDGIDWDVECISVPDQRPSNGSSIPGTSTADSDAYIVFTSGSTGQPKPITIKQTDMMALARAQLELFKFQPGVDKLLQILSPAFDGFVGDLTASLLNGVTMVIPGVDDPLAVINAVIDKHKVTACIMTPSMWETVDLPRDTPLKMAGCAGEVLNTTLATTLFRAGCRVFNLYGPAEATVMAVAGECHPGRAVTIGSPVLGKKIYIARPNGDLCAPGEVGELCIGGKGIGRYLRRPDINASKFRQFVDHRGANQRVYRTGDYGKWVSSGQISFHGRFDRQVKVNGQRIELDEVQAQLQADPGVDKAHIDYIDGRIIATVVKNEVYDEGTAVGRLKALLPSAGVPSAFVYTAGIRLSATGKSVYEPSSEVSVAATAPLATIGAVETITDSTHDAAVRPPTEHGSALPVDRGGLDMGQPMSNLSVATVLVSRIFSDVLNVPLTSLDVHSDFFSHGGDSLSRVRLLSRVNKQFGIQMSVAKLVSASSVESLSTEIVQLLKATKAESMA